MLTQTLCREYTQEVSPSGWTNFCEVLTEEKQGRLVVIERHHDQTEDSSAIADTLADEPKCSALYGFNYHSSLFRRCLIVTLGREGATCNHIVENPKKIEVLYEHGNQIFAVVITDEIRAQTVIYFEDDAIVIPGGSPQLQLLQKDHLHTAQRVVGLE